MIKKLPADKFITVSKVHIALKHTKKTPKNNIDKEFPDHNKYDTMVLRGSKLKFGNAIKATIIERIWRYFIKKAAYMPNNFEENISKITINKHDLEKAVDEI